MTGMSGKMALEADSRGTIEKLEGAKELSFGLTKLLLLRGERRSIRWW
jgi:hypothetical protein